MKSTDDSSNSLSYHPYQSCYKGWKARLDVQFQQEHFIDDSKHNPYSEMVKINLLENYRSRWLWTPMPCCEMVKRKVQKDKTCMC